MSELITHKLGLDGTHKQLVDLNKDFTLFDTQFTITPHTLDLGKPYEIAVLSQTALDSDDEVKFKKVDGIYSGSVKNDNPQSSYQNFFLVLKSDEPFKEMKIDVDIHGMKTPEKRPTSDELLYKQQMEMQQMQIEKFQQDAAAKAQVDAAKVTEKKQTSYLKFVIAFFVIIAGGYLMYYFYQKSKKSKPAEETKTIIAAAEPAAPAPEPVKIQVPPVKIQVPPVKIQVPEVVKPEIRTEPVIERPKPFSNLAMPGPSVLRQPVNMPSKNRFSDLLKNATAKKPPINLPLKKVFKPSSLSPPQRKLSGGSTTSSSSSSSSSSVFQAKKNIKGRAFEFAD
uniref:Uncharacterized protein n=1 Tax=viral metagenome TaxID=1070528 RepID=A0A6C0KRZ8_9ZZZZ